MTDITPDFRALAIRVIADNAECYPPKGWAAAFDARHSHMPHWALDGERPHEVFINAARRGRKPPSNGRAVPTYAAQLWNDVAAWLRANPEAPELVERIELIRITHGYRADSPEDWAPYQRMIDDDAKAAATADTPY